MTLIPKSPTPESLNSAEAARETLVMNRLGDKAVCWILGVSKPAGVQPGLPGLHLGSPGPVWDLHGEAKDLLSAPALLTWAPAAPFVGVLRLWL